MPLDLVELFSIKVISDSLGRRSPLLIAQTTTTLAAIFKA